jgi:RNA polymerase sigma-70 factor (ECF subfamily)
MFWHNKDDSRYEDLALLSRALRRGQESAFDYLFRTRYPKLVAYAVTLIRDRDAARDLVQDVFSAIWTKSANIREESSIDGYLHTCVYNKCIDHINNGKRYAGIVDYFIDNLRIEDAFEPDVSDYVWLNNAVESLPRQCREVLKMKIIDGKKYSEVAWALGISENTVKSQMKIAYRKIRECTLVKDLAAN